jgi:hypothetical protein
MYRIERFTLAEASIVIGFISIAIGLGAILNVDPTNLKNTILQDANGNIKTLIGQKIGATVPAEYQLINYPITISEIQNKISSTINTTTGDNYLLLDFGDKTKLALPVKFGSIPAFNDISLSDPNNFSTTCPTEFNIDKTIRLIPKVPSLERRFFLDKTKSSCYQVE